MATSNLPVVNFPYISIKFKTTTLTWRGGAPDYFTSLTYQRYVGKAATGTINITYAPGPGDNPNAVEEAIVFNKGQCLIRYGHTRGGISRLYKGLIYDYTCKVDNGVLSYTLSVVSKAVSYNCDRVPSFKIPTADKVLPEMKRVVDSFCRGYQGSEYIFDGGKEDFTIPESGIDIEGELGPIKVLSSIASKLISKDDDNRYFYTIEVDDSGSDSGYIRLLKIDTQKTSAEFSFEWGTKNSDIISWEPKFSGAVLIFKGIADDSKSDGSNTLVGNVKNATTTINPDTGETATFIPSKPGAESLSCDSQLESLDVANMNDQKFTEYGTYSYQATITVIGQAKELELGKSFISVKPFISGKLHHSAGKYKVVGITDNINSSGFTTSYELVKEPDENTIYGKRDKEKNYVYINGALKEYSEVNFYDDGSGRDS